MPPRWCLCTVRQKVTCDAAVDVLQHHGEAHKPSSSGGLIRDLVEGARVHLFHDRTPIDRQTLLRPGCEPWVLHPLGERISPPQDPRKVQLILLDGSWSQAKTMVREAAPLGRKVSLPMQGESRYWLRTQHAEGNFSTAEALIFSLEALGLQSQAAALRLQFELHVWASLRARGKLREAQTFLDTSPCATELVPLTASLA